MSTTTRTIKNISISASTAGFLFVSTVFAASPVGTWRAIDDNTGQPKSVVQIYSAKGTLQGKVVKLLPGAAVSVCAKCPGRLKNKPITGMLVMWGYKPGKNGTWGGGRILDPGSGKIYKSTLKISPNGKALSVRGYIGISAFGRTQTWQRIK